MAIIGGMSTTDGDHCGSYDYDANSPRLPRPTCETTSSTNIDGDVASSWSYDYDLNRKFQLSLLSGVNISGFGGRGVLYLIDMN